MNNREIDKLLSGAKLPQGPDEGMLGRIAGSISATMRPVRPLPPKWMLAGGTALACTLTALTGAACLGFSGVAKMSVPERWVVFSTLSMLVLVVAGELVGSVVPGSRRRFSSEALLVATSFALAVLLAACFRDYRTTHFLHAGIVCLGIGVLHAIPAGLLSWLVLRRGFAVDAVAACLTAGTLAGLSGVGMLELHCPNFQSAHVLVWHLGVVLVSAGLGAVCGRWSTLPSANCEGSGARNRRE